MSNIKSTKNLCLTCVILTLSACGGSDTKTSETLPNPIFSLAISDAPVEELSAVIVCFNQIQLKRSNGDIIYTVSDDNIIAPNDLCLNENDEIIPDTVGVNLLEFTGSDSLNLVNNTIVEAGVYTQIRLLMSDGSYAINKKTDEKINVTVPSNELKLDGFTATLGGIIDFTVEFDLRKGMTNPVGQSGYILKPRGVRLVDNTEAGHITGTVSEELLSNNANDGCLVMPEDLSTSVASIYLYQNADLEISTLADNGGNEDNQPLASTGVKFDGEQTYHFEIGFVNAENYTIALSCAFEDDPEDDDEVNFIEAKNVTVVTGNTPVDVHFDMTIDE